MNTLYRILALIAFTVLINGCQEELEQFPEASIEPATIKLEQPSGTDGEKEKLSLLEFAKGKYHTLENLHKKGVIDQSFKSQFGTPLWHKAITKPSSVGKTLIVPLENNGGQKDIIVGVEAFGRYYYNVISDVGYLKPNSNDADWLDNFSVQLSSDITTNRVSVECILIDSYKVCYSYISNRAFSMQESTANNTNCYLVEVYYCYEYDDSPPPIPPGGGGGGEGDPTPPPCIFNNVSPKLLAIDSDPCGGSDPTCGSNDSNCDGIDDSYYFTVLEEVYNGDESNADFVWLTSRPSEFNSVASFIDSSNSDPNAVLASRAYVHCLAEGNTGCNLAELFTTYATVHNAGLNLTDDEWAWVDDFANSQYVLALGGYFHGFSTIPSYAITASEEYIRCEIDSTGNCDLDEEDYMAQAVEILTSDDANPIKELIEKLNDIKEFLENCNEDNWKSYRNRGIVPYCFWENANTPEDEKYGPLDPPFMAGIADGVYKEIEAIVNLPDALDDTLNKLICLQSYFIKDGLCTYIADDHPGENIERLWKYLRDNYTDWYDRLNPLNDACPVSQISCNEAQDIIDDIEEMWDMINSWEDIKNLVGDVEEMIENYIDTVSDGSNESRYEVGRLVVIVATLIIPADRLANLPKVNRTKKVIEELRDFTPSQLDEFGDAVNAAYKAVKEDIPRSVWDDLDFLKAFDDLLNNASAKKHIFEGEINSSGNATGAHHINAINQGTARKIPGTQISGPNDLYKVKVEVRKPDGTWVPKTANGGYSSFFPDNWSVDRTMAEIAHAYKNKTLVGGNEFKGYSIDANIAIHMYLRSDGSTITAFPSF